jgi:hypothetical protein
MYKRGVRWGRPKTGLNLEKWKGWLLGPQVEFYEFEMKI